MKYRIFINGLEPLTFLAFCEVSAATSAGVRVKVRARLRHLPKERTILAIPDTFRELWPDLETGAVEVETVQRWGFQL